MTSSNQVFDTLSDKIKIAHAKDVKRSGGDKSEKHADIGDEDALEVAYVPRRGRDRAAGARPRLAQLRSLSEASREEAPEHSRSSSSISTKPTSRERRNSLTASCGRTACELVTPPP